MKHIHKVTFRGSLDIGSYNKLIRFLYDNKIPYKTINKISQIRDDAGLLTYYDSIIFEYDNYIPYLTNRKKGNMFDNLEVVK